jgi:hypothetical protein
VSAVPTPLRSLYRVGATSPLPLNIRKTVDTPNRKVRDRIVLWGLEHGSESLDVKREQLLHVYKIVYLDTIGSGGTLLEAPLCTSNDDVRHAD